MTADPEIPEAAVEAAARALDPQVFDYTALNVHKRSAFQSLARLRARAALAAAAPEIARAAKVEALREAAADLPSVSQRVHVQALINARADEIEAQS